MRASRGEGFSLSNAVRSEVLRKKTSLIISDAQFEPALREQKSIVAQRIRSIMAVPLQTQERVIGLIYVDNGSVLHPFSREDLDLLTVMANVAAIRIEHARLALVEQQERVMQMELDQAAEIQHSLLPETRPATTAGTSMATTWPAARWEAIITISCRITMAGSDSWSPMSAAKACPPR